MKKILGLTIAALLVMGLVGAGTWAYFSDPETMTGNYLSAGTLDLDVDGTDDPSAIFALMDVYPGQSSNDYVVLTNSGSLDGELDISISSVVNTENLTSGTEFQALGGAVLGASANISLWLDIDNDGNREATDFGIDSSGATYDPTTLLWDEIDDYGAMSADNVTSALMTPADTYRLYVEWQVATTIGNEIQADVVTFTITATLEQPTAD
jgi:predicted ribosomally synthesized peptide with SipW-like signal peptide